MYCNLCCSKLDKLLKREMQMKSLHHTRHQNFSLSRLDVKGYQDQVCLLGKKSPTFYAELENQN